MLKTCLIINYLASHEIGFFNLPKKLIILYMAKSLVLRYNENHL